MFKFDTTLSSSKKVDIIAAKFREKSDVDLTDGELERLYWLFDNDIDFTYDIPRGQNCLEITIHDEIDMMGYKLRWYGDET